MEAISSPQVGGEPARALDSAGFLEALATASPARLSFVHCLYGAPARFDPGVRCLPDHLLYFLDEGAISGRIAAAAARVRAGDFHWLSPGVEHHLYAPPGVALRNFAVRFHLEDEGAPLRIEPDALHLPDLPGARESLERLVQEHRLPRRFHFERMRALLTALLADALDRAAMPLSGGGAFGPDELLRLRRFVEQHAGQPRPGALAALFELSPDYFARKFRAQFGLSPQEWLQRERLQRAAAMLLETSLSSRQVAARLGYGDARFFTRQFKKQFGLAPRAYRLARR